MKKLILFFLAGIAFSCNNEAKTSTEAMKDTAAVTAEATPAVMNYPYSIEHPDNWEMGNTSNTLAALSSLKAWEEGKVKDGDLVCLAAFGSGFTWASALLRW